MFFVYNGNSCRCRAFGIHDFFLVAFFAYFALGDCLERNRALEKRKEQATGLVRMHPHIQYDGNPAHSLSYFLPERQKRKKKFFRQKKKEKVIFPIRIKINSGVSDFFEQFVFFLSGSVAFSEPHQHRIYSSPVFPRKKFLKV